MTVDRPFDSYIEGIKAKCQQDETNWHAFKHVVATYCQNCMVRDWLIYLRLVCIFLVRTFCCLPHVPG